MKQEVKYFTAFNSRHSLLLILWAYFDFFSWRKRGNHTVSNFSPHFLVLCRGWSTWKRTTRSCMQTSRIYLCSRAHVVIVWLAFRMLCHNRSEHWSLYPESLRGWRSQFLFVILVQSQLIFNNFYLKWVIIKSFAFPVILYPSFIP